MEEEFKDLVAEHKYLCDVRAFDFCCLSEEKISKLVEANSGPNPTQSILLESRLLGFRKRYLTRSDGKVI